MLDAAQAGRLERTARVVVTRSEFRPHITPISGVLPARHADHSEMGAKEVFPMRLNRTSVICDSLCQHVPRAWHDCIDGLLPRPSRVVVGRLLTCFIDETYLVIVLALPDLKSLRKTS